MANSQVKQARPWVTLGSILDSVVWGGSRRGGLVVLRNAIHQSVWLDVVAKEVSNCLDGELQRVFRYWRD
jgi:hypothetical protein